MSNIYDYIKNNNKSFKEDNINDIDKAILSLISYIDFDGIISNNKMRLDKALELFFKLKDKKEFFNKAFFDNDVYHMAELLIRSDRFKDIILSDYILKNTNNEQFAAISMRLPDHTLFISYEGTDNLISGWKEDCELSYEYPIPAQIDAIKYVNDVVKLSDLKVILLGHSKGGNLALVAAMNMGFINRLKLKEIFSVDSPGLREEELNSNEFKRIENKYRHIISNHSIVGLLLYNIKSEVYKSNKRGLYAHSPLEWELDNNKFVKEELSNFSTKLGNKIDIWLSNRSYEERRKVVNDIFNIFDELNIKTLLQIKNPVMLIKIIRETRKLDEDTKEILKSIMGE